MSFSSNINLEETTQKYDDHLKCLPAVQRFFGCSSKTTYPSGLFRCFIADSVSGLSLPQQGELITFHGCCDRTITIIEQEAIEDDFRDGAEFEIYRNSVNAELQLCWRNRKNDQKTSTQ